MAQLELLHIHKRYGKNTYAVRDFNLKVKDGEFLVLVGPSGCGKTTLLRMVAGLESITDGQLFINDKVANDMEPHKREVAMVFQDYSLFPNMTVFENIEFALKIKRIPKRERTDRVNRMAKLLGVEDLLDRKAKGLSGGQCQRIAIGRALVCNPQFFLLDEPLSNLDPQMRERLKEEIARIQRELKVTTLYVTHDQVEAMSLGDRIVVMNEGEIQQVDTPQNLFYKPANAFVAKYIGQKPMRFFKARCCYEDGAVSLRSEYLDAVLPKWKADAVRGLGYENKEVLVGVRSNNLTITDRGDEEGVDLTNTVFRYVENFGYYQEVTLGLGDDRVVAEFKGDEAILGSSDYFVKLDIEAIHLFDAESGEAIVH